MKRVLVIDDDVLLVRLIEHNLSQVEVQVLKAYSGYEGISLARTQQPDLVILDIVLPDMGGIAVLKKLLEISPDIPIIMITGYDNIERAEKCLKMGARDYITKPFDFDYLRTSILANILSGNR